MNPPEQPGNSEHETPEGSKPESRKPVLPKIKVKKIRQWRVGRLVFVSFLVLLAAAYFYLTSPAVVEKFLTSTFNQMSNGKLSLKVSRASLFRGLVLEDIVITSGPDFDHRPLLKVKKFSFVYNLFGFWAGDFGVHELGIYQPQIYLLSKAGRWNTDTLMKKSSEKEQPEEIEEEESSGPMPGEIHLPFSLRFFFKFVLQDFSVSVVSDQAAADSFDFKLKNFNFETYFLTKKFDTIPLNLQIFELVDTLLVNLNRQKDIDIFYENHAVSTGTPFALHWLLALDESGPRLQLKSGLEVGKNSIPVRYSGKHLLPLDFRFDYQLNYFSQEDRLELAGLQLSFLKDVWFHMKGQIDHLTESEKMKIDLHLDRSDIRLESFYPYYLSFTGDQSLKFRGAMSLAPLDISGPLSDLKIGGAFEMKKFLLTVPDLKIDIPSFRLTYHALVNKNRAEPMPLLEAGLNWRGQINGATTRADMIYIPAKKVDVVITLDNFEPAPYAHYAAVNYMSMPFDFKGIFNFYFDLKGNRETDLLSSFKIVSPGFYYSVDNDRSPINKLLFNVSTAVKSDAGFNRIVVTNPDISLVLQNKVNRKAVWLQSDSRLVYEADKIAVQYNISDFSVNMRTLNTTLPEGYQEMLEPVVKALKKNITLRGSTSYMKSGSEQDIENKSYLLLEDYDVRDIVFSTRVQMRPGLVNLRSLELTGFKQALKFTASGTYKDAIVEKLDPNDPDKTVMVEGSYPDIVTNFSFGKKKREKVFQDHAIEGEISLKTRMQGNIVHGDFVIDHFFYDNGGFVKVNNVNVNFPFEHNIIFRKALRLTSGNKERIIRNYNFNRPFNFTVDSVEIAHPVRDGESFRLIYPTGEYAGISSTMFYEDNVFQMPVMQINMLNGLVSLRDMIFNVGRMRLPEMEYLFQMQVKDIDLKQLIPPEKSAAIQDGSIRMDMSLVGDGLHHPIENMKGYASVYKIGKEFGKQALKVVKPDTSALVDFTIDQSIIVNKLDMDIREGLVYMRIFYQKGFFGNIVGPAGDEIVQERIPIPEFMQRAGQEAQVYKLETRKKENGSGNGFDAVNESGN